MLFVFLSLLGGVFLGRIFRSEKGQYYAQQATKILVLALLFTMGSQLGSNSELWQALPTIGLTSLVITLGSILGGLVLNILYTPLAKKAKPRFRASWEKVRGQNS